MAHVKQIYANLCGTWTDVTNCIIDRNENAIKYFDEVFLILQINMIMLLLNMVIKHIVFIQVKFKLFFSSNNFLSHVSFSNMTFLIFNSIFNIFI